MEKGYQFPEVTSWIRANKKDFELVKELGMKETGILVSCSDYHIFYKMKMTRKECMEHYLSVVREDVYKRQDHNKTFQYAVYIGEEKFGIGTGRTKKAAEQSAAYESILKLRAKNKK